MPVDMKRYPKNWREISHQIRFVRADGRCEGTEQFPDCQAVHGKPHPDTGSKVVLTTAHIGAPHADGSEGDKHDKMDVRPENLLALCQRCHLNLDIKEHVANRMATMRKRKEEAGQLVLVQE